MKRGLLVQRLEWADAGLYTCTSHEHSYHQVLARYRLHVIPNHSLHSARPQHSLSSYHPQLYEKTGPAGSAGFLGHPGSQHPPFAGHRNGWLQAPPPRSYKDQNAVASAGLSVDEYCEQLWYREKRRQQKLRTLKLKQGSRKARVRRNNPPQWPL